MTSKVKVRCEGRRGEEGGEGERGGVTTDRHLPAGEGGSGVVDEEFWLEGRSGEWEPSRLGVRACGVCVSGVMIQIPFDS